MGLPGKFGAYGAPGRLLPISLRACYAMSGTDIPYAPAEDVKFVEDKTGSSHTDLGSTLDP
eukprot:2273910-Rhodomonas_salina.2